MQTGVTPRGPKREIGGLREFGWRERAGMRNAKECFFYYCRLRLFSLSHACRYNKDGYDLVSGVVRHGTVIPWNLDAIDSIPKTIGMAMSSLKSS